MPPSRNSWDTTLQQRACWGTVCNPGSELRSCHQNRKAEWAPAPLRWGGHATSRHLPPLLRVSGVGLRNPDRALSSPAQAPAQVCLGAAVPFCTVGV